MALRPATLFISNEYFHHHSDGILTKYDNIRNAFTAALQQEAILDFIDRKKKPGISSPSVNSEIRRLLSCVNDILFEVNQEDGIYYVTGQTNGFDFALIDKPQNLINYRNLCFGKRQFLDGPKQWSTFLEKNPKYEEIVQELNLPNPQPEKNGEDMDAEKTAPIILGEIQFGNWGLAYRDLFKTLQANILTTVDVLIYIVADGRLHTMLSNSIVNYKGTKAIIKDFAKVITVPVWIIGIDFK